MKRFLSRHGHRARCAVAILTAALFGASFHAAGADPFSSVAVPVALFALLASVPSREGVLGISYPVSNAKTLASAIADTPKAPEELWAKAIYLGEKKFWEIQPFIDNMSGPAGSGKAFVEVLETQRVEGNTINIPLSNQIAGEGVTGDNIRSGNETQFQVGNMQVLIGRYWVGVSFTSVARDQTVLGRRFEAMSRDGLTQMLAKKRADDTCMTMRLAARTDKGAQNRLYPAGRSGRDSITTNDVLSTSIVEQGNAILPGFGAQPMNTGKDASGSEKPFYMVLANSYAVSNFVHDSIYRNAVTNSDVRGPANANFKGTLLPWDGSLIYRWVNADHPNKGPLGNGFMARGRLGIAISNAAAGTVVQMGGNMYNAADTPVRQYAQFFSGAPYTFANGDTQALYPPTTSLPTTDYILIVNPDGSCGVFSYSSTTGNNGATITIAGQQTIANATAVNFVKNALVLQCNAIGTPLCQTLFYGAEAVAGGVGSINGKKADDPALRMANVRNDEEDKGRVQTYSAETVWGVRAVERVDGTYPNFAVMTHAYMPPGVPALN